MKISTFKFVFILALLLSSATVSMAQITTLGIIGSATANGWNTSTPMTQTTAGGHDWTITLPLIVGEVKFRTNNDWAVNWGATGFPTGTGTQNGANIPVPTAGNYRVNFNDVTGNYSFTVVTAAKSANDVILGLNLAPNPASSSLLVSYELPVASTATIKVLNLLGQQVREFTPVAQAAGSRNQQLSLSGIAAGIYLVKLQTPALTQTTRLVVE